MTVGGGPRSPVGEDNRCSTAQQMIERVEDGHHSHTPALSEVGDGTELKYGAQKARGCPTVSSTSSMENNLGPGNNQIAGVTIQAMAKETDRSIYRPVCVHDKLGVCSVHGRGAKQIWKPVGRTVEWVGGRKVTKTKKKFMFVCDVDPMKGGRLKQPTLSFGNITMKTTRQKTSSEQGYLELSTSTEGQNSGQHENLE